MGRFDEFVVNQGARMHVYEEEPITDRARLHPYRKSSPLHNGYEDFTANPQLIRTVLEDFRPLERWEAVQRFYSFLEWINGPKSKLETSDCALSPPAQHQDANSRLALRTHGRVVVLHRDLRLNSSDDHTDWLLARLQHGLSALDPGFSASEGGIGLALNPVLQAAISNGLWLEDGTFSIAADGRDPGLGRHLMVSFRAYGDTDTETFKNLDRLMTNLWSACGAVCGENVEAQNSKGSGVD